MAYHQQKPKGISWIQKILIALLPAKWTLSMEAESREWIARCKHCEHENSIWDLGGVRWKARGREWSMFRCLKCKQVFWGEIQKRKPDTEEFNQSPT